MLVIRSGAFLLAGASFSTAQGIPSTQNDSPVGVMPHPSQGSVEGSGKFIPANPQAEIPQNPPPPGEWREAVSKLIEKTGEHTFRIGIVHCDRMARTLTIPAEVNARDGLIEYALVTRKGKIHESLFSTEADPLHVQMAALLLDMSPQPGQPQAFDVMIEVEWATNGPPRKLPLEDLIALAKETPQNASGDTLAPGPWKYTGSLIDANGFVAAREGSLIALIEDPAALIGNPRPGRVDDDLHVPNAAAMPGPGMPVSIRILPNKPPQTSDAQPAEPSPEP